DAVYPSQISRPDPQTLTLAGRIPAVDRNEPLLKSIRAELARSPSFKRVRFEEAGRVEVTGASFEARALLLATLQEQTGERIAIITPGDAALDDFEQALRLFHHDPRCVSSYPASSRSAAASSTSSRPTPPAPFASSCSATRSIRCAGSTSKRSAPTIRPAPSPSIQ